ncbi:MAG: hypothetical protein K9M36_00675 [Candidatus Pacebacteria bacterium]|nr:hypothetical protein [Candidatus Paceibacterota bacterium]
MTINILTTEYKKQIDREMKKRSVMIVLYMGMALLLCAGILFSGLYMYARVNYSIAEASLQTLLDQDENQEYRDIVKRIRDVNTKTKKALVTFQQPTISDIVIVLGEKASAGIALQEIRIVQSTEDNPGTVFMRGIAQTREDLLFFIQTIKNHPAFLDVVVPVSHFVAGNDVTFSLSAILAEPQ